MARNDDTMTFDGATKLAKTIKAYWAQRGIKVSPFLIESVRTDKNGNVTDKFYSIRSDLNAAYPGKPLDQTYAQAA